MSDSPRKPSSDFLKFTLWTAAAAVALAAIPLLAGASQGQAGAVYLQQQTALDDQMVYAAWMKQAQSGSFTLENLFAVEQQPKLTIHLYFWVLGLLSALLGIPTVLTVARLGFSFLFVWLLGRFLIRLGWEEGHAKIGLVLGCFGAGLGSMAWETFGRLMQKPSLLAPLTNGRLPIDVWQPEAFVFPSMLTSGLFMASLCLILVSLQCVLDAKTSWKPVVPGAAAMLVLMNIHSYDVLLVALVLVGFLAGRLGAGALDWTWIGRAALIGCGALPSAAWFLYVLSQDQVFRARAATLTFSSTSAQVLAGILPLVVLAVCGGIFRRDGKPETRNAFLALAGALVIYLVLGISGNPDGYWMNLAAWSICFAAALALLFFMREEDESRGLLWAWAITALVAIYFPGLFQRKLAMGLALPWAALAALGMAPLLDQLEKTRRLALMGVGAVVCCISSVLWIAREVLLVQRNVSSTTTHAPLLDAGAAQALAALEKTPGRVVVLAMPGIPGQVVDKPEGAGERQPNGQPWPVEFVSPALPDLNPMVAGLAGKFAYAGHWSETPSYDDKRSKASRFFLAATSADEAGAIAREAGATHALAPKPAAFEGLPLRDPAAMGRVIFESDRWAVVELPR